MKNEGEGIIYRNDKVKTIKFEKIKERTNGCFRCFSTYNENLGNRKKTFEPYQSRPYHVDLIPVCTCALRASRSSPFQEDLRCVWFTGLD